MNMNESGPTSFRGKHLVVFGAGYVGGALVREALAAGLRVTALTRNAATAAELRAAGAGVVVGELSSEAWWPELAAGGVDLVAVTVAAGGGGVEGYRRSYVDGLRSVTGWVRGAAAGGRVPPLVYTSSTSVYPQDGGVRVTEADAAGGEAETTRALIESEGVAAAWPGAATVLRLAGIYGPGRTHLVEQVRSGEVAGKPEMHLNLVYRDDIVAGIWAAFASASGRPAGSGGGAKIFNLADEGEATKGEVAGWLAERLGVAMPRFTGQPAGGRRAVTPDRIVDASRARAELGWRAVKRTFREGYAEVLGEAGVKRGPVSG
jgi:nucleoside-diphosphate-sugar epimerase